MTIILFLACNILMRCSFLAAMCWCISTGHTRFAVACFIGSLFGGYSITRTDEGRSCRQGGES